MMRQRLQIQMMVAGLALVVCGAALADGPRGNVIAPDALDAESRATLEQAIATARVNDAEAFIRFADVRDAIAELDANKRGRLAPVPSILKRLGKRALLPMLEMLAFDAPARGELTETAWIALRAGTIEAVGDHMDPRAAPVLYAILDSAETEYYVVRATAESIGLYGTDRAMKRLIDEAQTPGPKQFGVLAGMGACRRASVATALATALASSKDARTTQMLVNSLADVGNSYVWTIPAVAKRGEGDEARATAAAALVSAFKYQSAYLRKKVSNAIMVVDAPGTPALIAQELAQASDAQLTQDLEKLQTRFTNNPVRR